MLPEGSGKASRRSCTPQPSLGAIQPSYIADIMVSYQGLEGQGGSDRCTHCRLSSSRAHASGTPCLVRVDKLLRCQQCCNWTPAMCLCCTDNEIVSILPDCISARFLACMLSLVCTAVSLHWHNMLTILLPGASMHCMWMQISGAMRQFEICFVHPTAPAQYLFAQTYCWHREQSI